MFSRTEPDPKSKAPRSPHKDQGQCAGQGEDPYERTSVNKRTAHVLSAYRHCNVYGDKEEASANSMRRLRSRPRPMLWRQAMVSDSTTSGEHNNNHVHRSRRLLGPYGDRVLMYCLIAVAVEVSAPLVSLDSLRLTLSDRIWTRLSIRSHPEKTWPQGPSYPTSTG